MEVILRQAVEKLGHPGDIVKVSPGYARNFLLPRGVAYEATPGNKKRIERESEITDPNVVKVVTDREGNAIYFSRSPIPYVREAGGEPTAHFKHIGLYVYRRDFLLAYSDLPVGPLERAERLEQLRALENGFRIRVVETEYESMGVDTPEDWARVSELFEKLMVTG